MIDLVVRVAGEAGEGPTTIGDFLARSAARSGYSVYTFQTFPSEIRGGHAYLQTRIAEETTLSYGDRPDVLLALNQEAYDRWAKVVKPDGLMMYDSSRFQVPADNRLRTLGIPGEKLATEEVGSKIAQNVVMFGAFAGLAGIDRDICEKLIRDRWGSKGEKVVASNLKALDVGSRFAREQGINDPHLQLPRCGDGSDRVILTGYQALCLGAVAAGLKYFGGYPITPATQIMEWLARYLPGFGGSVVQMEDEISALGSVLGASFGGAKAMTSTSGPGLALMVEMLGLATMAEVPAVIIDVQRGGPSTGMPTKTEQSDLNLAIYGAHGDAPRVVLAVTSVEDSFYTTMHAFNLAERLQTPVIVLSDQALTTRISTMPTPDPARVKVENRATVAAGTNPFNRFEVNDSGVSAVATPGTAGRMFTATGLEHNERGNPSTDPAMRRAMVQKRAKKMDLALDSQDDLVRWWGDPNGSIGVLGWGSSEGVIREAVARAREAGHPVIAMHPRLLCPLPMKHLQRLMRQCRRILVPECNAVGQFAQYVKSQCFGQWDGQFISWNKCDGNPFTPEEIFDGICSIAD
jgi:2-oxoglutarate ferredoxin oxidoreductase subunit alpha